jgi:hypothetical protein
VVVAGVEHSETGTTVKVHTRAATPADGTFVIAVLGEGATHRGTGRLLVKLVRKLPVMEDVIVEGDFSGHFRRTFDVSNATASTAPGCPVQVTCCTPAGKRTRVDFSLAEPQPLVFQVRLDGAVVAEASGRVIVRELAALVTEVGVWKRGEYKFEIADAEATVEAGDIVVTGTSHNGPITSVRVQTVAAQSVDGTFTLKLVGPDATLRASGRLLVKAVRELPKMEEVQITPDWSGSFSRTFDIMAVTASTDPWCPVQVARFERAGKRTLVEFTMEEPRSCAFVVRLDDGKVVAQARGRVAKPALRVEQRKLDRELETEQGVAVSENLSVEFPGAEVSCDSRYVKVSAVASARGRTSFTATALSTDPVIEEFTIRAEGVTHAIILAGRFKAKRVIRLSDPRLLVRETEAAFEAPSWPVTVNAGPVRIVGTNLGVVRLMAVGRAPLSREFTLRCDGGDTVTYVTGRVVLRPTTKRDLGVLEVDESLPAAVDVSAAEAVRLVSPAWATLTWAPGQARAQVTTAVSSDFKLIIETADALVTATGWLKVLPARDLEVDSVEGDVGSQLLASFNVPWPNARWVIESGHARLGSTRSLAVRRLSLVEVEFDTSAPVDEPFVVRADGDHERVRMRGRVRVLAVTEQNLRVRAVAGQGWEATCEFPVRGARAAFVPASRDLNLEVRRVEPVNGGTRVKFGGKCDAAGTFNARLSVRGREGSFAGCIELVVEPKPNP